MIDVTIDFGEVVSDETNLTILIGKNGAAKSYLLEAIVAIFRNLDLGEEPPFAYNFEYECNTHQVIVDANPERKEKVKITVDNKRVPFSSLINDPERLYLPSNLFGYYSGTSTRLQKYFREHHKKYYYDLLKWEGGQKPLSRPLFFARTYHSQYVLLAFFSFEDESSKQFLKEHFGITGFKNAEFVLKRPKWSKTKGDEENFWGARGVVREFLNDLRDCSLPPLKIIGRVPNEAGKYTREEQICFRINDLTALRNLSSRYKDNTEFFKTLESAYISDIIRRLEVRIQKDGVVDSLAFSQLSEGERQLLTVLGLIKFTNKTESLFLLDEPDTHLHPSWKRQFTTFLERAVPRKEKSHILMATHDPLVVGGLKKEQIQIFTFEEDTNRHVIVSPSSENTVGMGVPRMLRDLFETVSLDNKAQEILDKKTIIASKKHLTADDRINLKKYNKELDEMGFANASDDPNYSWFLEAQRKYDLLKLESVTDDSPQTVEQLKEYSRKQVEVLGELLEKLWRAKHDTR